MAKTVLMVLVENPVAMQQVFGTITVANTDATAVVLTALSISESSKTGCIIQQPQFQALNTPVSLANPTINASSSASYAFSIVCPSPYNPGPSPSNAGGAAATANPPTSGVYLVAQGQTSDGTVFTSTIFVPVLSATQPAPSLQGGAALLGQGQNSSLIAVVVG